MRRKSHLEVTHHRFQMTEKQRAKQKELFELTRILQKAIACIPRDVHYNLARTRDTMKQQLKNLRFNIRGNDETRDLLHFTVKHRQGVEFRYHSGHRENRPRALSAVRAQIRTVRADLRWLSPHVNQIDSRGFPYRNQHRTEPGVFLRAHRTRQSFQVYEPKRPQCDNPYVGIELEFISLCEKSTLGAAIADAGLTQYVHLHHDGSVDCSPNRGGESFEISVLVQQSKVAEVIPKLCKVLNGHSSYVNGTCGMHVHLDMRQRDLNRAFVQLVRAQSTLYAMVPKSRKTNRYCKPTRGLVVDRHTSERASRYKGINARAFRRHKTLEVRIHSGTLSSTKIVNWVELLLAIVDGPELSITPRTPKSLARHLGLSESLRNYINERITHFATTAEQSRLTAVDEAPAVREPLSVPETPALDTIQLAAYETHVLPTVTFYEAPTPDFFTEGA